MNTMNKILGTNYKVVECYRTEDADMVVVILGSAAGVVKDVVDYYRDVKGYKIGVVRPVLFNPPCYEELAYGMRKAQVVSVLERSGTAHNQLLLADVQAALQISIRAGREGKTGAPASTAADMPTLLHGVYGLGSKDFNKYDAAAVVENMVCLFSKRSGAASCGIFTWGSRGRMTSEAGAPARVSGAGVGHDLYRRGRRGGEDGPGVRGPDLCGGQRAGHRNIIQSGARYGAARKGAPVFMNLRIVLSAHPQQLAN